MSEAFLQIDFSLLLDVRIIKHGEKVNEVHVGDQDVVTNFNVHVGDRDVVMNLGDDRKHGKAHAPAQG